ncbi:MAG: hypothetical protein WCN98_12640 [Verrucomicrobiaceae bacterium]
MEVNEPGIYRYRGREVKKEHILPYGRKDLNFLPLIRDAALKLKDASGAGGLKWHHYSHHLNSSQVLAVNLFQPLLQTGDEGLRTLAKITATGFPCHNPTGFEFVPNPNEGTNIDFCVTGKGGQRVFMELKLTEEEFGSARNDERHQNKFHDIYSPLCRNKITLPDGAEWATFKRFYQVFRNVVYADRKTKVWFVIPKPHQVLLSQLNKAMTFVHPAITSQIQVVHLGDLFRQIQLSVAPEAPVAEHYMKFFKKYAPALV